MIGIVLVSHSIEIANGIKKMIAAITKVDENSLPIYVASGNAQDNIGTDANKIKSQIEAANKGDGVVVVCDLGSSILSTQTAIASLPQDVQAKVKIADAPLVEGAIAASVEVISNNEADLDIVLASTQSARQMHKK